MYFNYTIAATLLICCLYVSKIVATVASDERTTRSRTENLRRSLKGQSNKNRSEDDVQEAYIAQQLDHFDATNDATFQQRYFVSYRHHHSKGIDESKNGASSSLPTISLLCVGGEGPGFTKSVLVDSVHCSGDMLELAKRIAKTAPHQYNIVLYALEHRYYGKSYPQFKNGNHTTSPLMVENLRFLSSRQALEDLAHFVQTMNRNTDASSSNTWVTFGGSYPGMMSLYARYKYPHLIFASVSSSAPIEVTVDFPGYKAKQGWDLKYETIGGSAKCHDIVKTGHNQAVALLKEKAGNHTNTTEDGSVKLAKQFNLCNPDTVLSKRRNQDSLLGDGLINIMSQNNDQACTENDLCNIAGLCRFLIDQVEDLELSKPLDGRGNVELEALARTAQKQFELEREQRARKGDGNDQQDGQQEANQFSQQWMSLQQRQRRQLGNDNDDDDCVNVDYEETVKAFSNTTIKPFGFRSWLWQTCTEFGFYQTCGDDCPFASHFHSVDMDLELCNRLFNITSDAVYDNVQATLDHYGGKSFLNSGASRILTINGDVDPWSVLGLNKDDDDSNYLLPIKMVKGASHHFWTHAVKNTDDREIIKIREFIYSCVMNWLGIETASSTTTMSRAANSIVANDVVASYGNSLFYEALKR